MTFTLDSRISDAQPLGHIKCTSNYSLHKFHDFIKAQYTRCRLYRDLWIYLFILIPTIVYIRLTNLTKDAYFIGARTWGEAAYDEMPPVDMQSGPTEGPDFYEIDGDEKWGLWFEAVLLPKLFDADHPNASYPMGWAGIEGSNLLAGGLRVRQQRAKTVVCDEPIPGVVCYESGRGSDYANDPSDNGPLAYISCDSWLEKAYGGIATVSKTFGCDGNSFVIPSNASYEQAVSILYDVLLPNGVTDFASTRFLVVEYVTYNIPSDIFVYNALWIQGSLAGRITPQGLPRPFRFDTTGDRTFCIIMLVIVLGLLIHRFLEFYFFARENSFLLAIRNELFNLWPLVKTATLVAYAAQIGFMLQMWVLADSYKRPIITPETAAIFPQDLMIYSGMFDSLLIIRAVILLLVFLRILEFGALFPPIYMVSTAISRAAKSILGACVLCIIAVVAFAVSGYIVFGARVEGFRDVPSAIDSVSRMLVGDYDISELENRGVVLATMYYWAFIIICFFILLNFITAIISGAIENMDSDVNASHLSDTAAFYVKYLRMWWAGTFITSTAGESLNRRHVVYTLRRYPDEYELAYSQDPHNFERNIFRLLKGAVSYLLFSEPHLNNLRIATRMVNSQPAVDRDAADRIHQEYPLYERAELYMDVEIDYNKMHRIFTDARGEWPRDASFKRLSTSDFNYLWLTFLRGARNVENDTTKKRVEESIAACWEKAGL